MHCDDATLGSIPKTQISARLALWRPNKTDLEEARGPSAARVTSAHPQGRIRVRSSWPERSEGHERSPAGAYSCVPSQHTCIRSPGGEQATVKCVCVYVCICICVYVSMCTCALVYVCMVCTVCMVCLVCMVCMVCIVCMRMRVSAYVYINMCMYMCV